MSGHEDINMEAKKYGVSLSALKSLQEFHVLLKEEKRKRLALPFQAECSVSVNNGDTVRVTVCADAGSLSIYGFGVIFLKNRISSINEADTQVTFESKGLFKKIVMNFDHYEEKTRFVTSLGNLFEENSDESSSSSGDNSAM